MLLNFVLRAGEFDLAGGRESVGRRAFDAGREIAVVAPARGGGEEGKEEQARQLRVSSCGPAPVIFHRAQ
ncbi:hypothetical protein [Sphingosinicella sp. BN140058]|uniref:hypothetical protein n=1 Tax=Sphingosinicella sp. BN140058 TaxID=1892855 RepID=UPI001012FE27|nr:hypothetical protein [Sphingosinicella sp. BN140058]QAY78678.1 hypothetical protein ETR14_20645 [Sphingosinicella sp. BN140058]